MKRIALFTLFLALGAVAAAYVSDPAEFALYAAAAEKGVLRAWTTVEAHPVPLAFAVGTFFLTVIYHKAKGKSLRESVEAAATRVTVVSVPAQEPAERDSPVVARAKARTTRTQLLADQIGLQNRQRKLPQEITEAEKDVCYAQQAVADTKRALGEKHKAHNVARTKLARLRKEKAEADAELAAIEAELKKLAERV